MPYRSLAQERYFNANRARMEAQGVDVDEWNHASKGKSLPRRASVKMKTKTVDLGKKGSFKEHPGALHEALGIPLGEKIPASKLAGHHTGRLGRMIASARGFKAMHHGK